MNNAANTPLNTSAADTPENIFLPEKESFSQSASNPPKTPPELAGDYEFLEEIGRGTQGHVFRARDLHHNRIVAIKQLKIGSVANWKDYELFQREANVLATLDIPGVAKFYESREFLDIEQPAAYIVQEYIEGNNLASILASGTRFSVNQVHQILIQCLHILDKLHTHDPAVIHRDIKPSNIILVQNDSNIPQVYLIDFGAVANPQVQGGGSTVAGTYGYMPPEQLMGRTSPQSDIYSLAATAVYLFSGVSPEKMQNKDFHLIFEPYMQSMPSALLYILRAMLAPDSKNRFCDIQDLCSIFTEFQKGYYEIPSAIVESLGDEATYLKNVKQYHHQLKKVQHINEPGNIELWQQLPNQTPRKVPFIYRHIRLNQILSSASTQSILKARNNDNHDQSNSITRFLIQWFACIYFALPPLARLTDKQSGCFAGLFLLFIIACTAIFLFAITIYLIISFPLLFCIYIAITAVIAFVLVQKKSHRCFQPFIEQPDNHKTEEPPSNRSTIRLIKSILQNGTKTIATITDIQYIDQPEGIYRNTITDNLVHTRKPLFKISYTFNPVDDHNPDNLLHEIYTHTPPEDHYQIGDPLPILYYIPAPSEDSPNKEFVLSIPFPLPMSGQLDLYRLIGTSQNIL
ncbi:MAG: serine/threonine protein kinase [Proteobacteria bacterium]|nr:serine/threonine protein kinase [Pseudomonadota bacterium]